MTKKINELDEALLALRVALEACIQRWNSNPNDYFGTQEFAYVMGVSKQTLSNQLKRGTLIEPIARLAMGPIWTRQQVRAHIFNTH